MRFATHVSSKGCRSGTRKFVRRLRCSGASITRSGLPAEKQLSTRGKVQAASVLVSNNPVAQQSKLHGSGPSFV